MAGLQLLHLASLRAARSCLESVSRRRPGGRQHPGLGRRGAGFGGRRHLHSGDQPQSAVAGGPGAEFGGRSGRDPRHTKITKPFDFQRARIWRARIMQMRFRSGCLLAGGLVAAVLWLGCTGRYESAFPVVVVNRAANTLQVLANGSEIGQVTSGQSASFSLHLAETSPNILVNGVAPTPQADVIFSAKDMRTGAMSQTKTVTLSQNPPTYVTFSTSDFPNVAPTVARFTNSPMVPGVNQDVFFNATSSSATNATYTWDFGDGTSGSGVTVTHRYLQTGAVVVVLNVVSDNGQSSTVSRSITISAGLPPTAANFTFSPTTPGLNQAVVFSASPIAGATF